VSGLCADTAAILKEGHVPDIMIAIFDGPMRSHGTGELLGGRSRLAGIERDLVGFVPKTGFGVLVPSQAGDASDGKDQPGPVGADAIIDSEGFHRPMLLAAMLFAIDGFVAVERQIGVGNGPQGVEQLRLVGLDLDKQEVPALFGYFKGFF